MAFIPLVNGIRVTMEYTLAGEPVINVYHVVSDSPVVTVNLEAVAQLFLSWWDGGASMDVRQYFSTDMALVRVTATDVSVADGEQYVLQPSAPLPGVREVDSAPNNVAWVISLRSALTGRSRRGRNYYAGLGEDLIVNNIMDSALAINIVDTFTILASELITEGYELVVASYVSLGAPRVTALATPITIITADTVVDSQRRRLP